MSARPIVFISYSWDSEPHKARVLAVAERLRKHGYDVSLDRYVNDTPQEGWPQWMLNQLDAATHVLVVCTSPYYRRFRGLEPEPDVGKGAAWEGGVIMQELYDTKGRSGRFIPVLFEVADKQWIPEPLLRRTFHNPSTESGLLDLRKAIEGVAGLEAATLGQFVPLERARATPSRPVASAQQDAAVVQEQLFDADALTHAQRDRLLTSPERPGADDAWLRRLLHVLDEPGNPNTGKVKGNDLLTAFVDHVARADSVCLHGVFHGIQVANGGGKQGRRRWSANLESYQMPIGWVTELICFVATRMVDLNHWRPMDGGVPHQARLYEVKTASALIAAVGLSHITGIPVVWGRPQEQGSVIDVTPFLSGPRPDQAILATLYDKLEQAGNFASYPANIPPRPDPDRPLEAAHLACLRYHFQVLSFDNQMPVIFLNLPQGIPAEHQTYILNAIADALGWDVRVVRGDGDTTQVDAQMLALALDQSFSSLNAARSASS